MPVGDVTSDVRGSGARYNDGKPAYSLMPLHILVRYLHAFVPQADGSFQALTLLAEWQARRGDDEDLLFMALDAMHYDLQPDADDLERVQDLAEACQVFDYGRQKYADWNWAKGMPWSVPLECAVRHLLADMSGEIGDSESGLSHLGHAACNIIMLITFAQTYPEGDDRPRPELLRPLTEDEVDEAEAEWQLELERQHKALQDSMEQNVGNQRVPGGGL